MYIFCVQNRKKSFWDRMIRKDTRRIAGLFSARFDFSVEKKKNPEYRNDKM